MKFDAKEVITKEFIMSNVLYQVVSPNNVPDGAIYREFQNLAVIYRVLISADDEHTLSYAVRDSLLEVIGISSEELDVAAKRNTRKKGVLILPVGGPMFLVISQNPWGASVMLFPEFLRTIHERIGEDFYILPSSIHELICVPAQEVTPEEMKRIVMDANRTVVGEDEYLSDSVYIYRAAEREVLIAAE